MTDQATYIPYKHILLIIVLGLAALWLTVGQETTGQELVQKEHVTTVSTTLKAVPFSAKVLTSPLEHSESITTVANTSKAPVSITEWPPQPMLLGKELPEKKLSTLRPLQQPVEKETPEKHEDKVVIRQGDILSVLFDRYNLGQTALRQVLSADESLLALETLRPGHILYFRYKKNTQTLKEVELYRHSGYRVVYRRITNNAFDYKTLIKEGQWHSERVSGSIEGIFYLSAKRAGLTEAETAIVTEIFQEQLNFSRAIRKGDKFQVVRSVQTIDGQLTGQTRIDSARIQRRVHEHTAFLFNDGRYYDKQGKSLAGAFTRTPLIKSYRISSPFNPKRKHPVTGRIGPHNGVDFATPRGTKVLSTGDGVVSRVGNHPYAGRYIDIQHGGQYKTRYLHLQRVLVRKGESISRGQTIALSGNSGRSTGPHLHFELHVNGHPVDPMRAKIPITRSIPKKYQHTFAKLVSQQTAMLDAKNQAIKLASNKAIKIKRVE